MLQSLPWTSLFGGMLLGISASLLLLFNGKIAGISGIVSGLFSRSPDVDKSDVIWRWLFFVGMVEGGLCAGLIWPDSVPSAFSSSTITLIVAGLLVGIGTKVGNGCTSGHGICGIGRLSTRSLVATLVFMAAASVTVYVRLHLV